VNTVSFRNRGLIDLRAVRTFGVSAKECANPIGFFGTGLKYAIAICLRLNCTVTLWRGTERYDFATRDASVRNANFRVITMNDEELAFTTDLGKTWEPWQAFRELYCNTVDEGGECIEGEASPLPDHTTIVVTGAPFHAAWRDRDRIVLRAIPRWRTERVEIHDAPGMCAYYRGIRVANLQKPAALTYNVLSNLELTEDRTLKESWRFQSAVRDAILESDDEQLIARFLTAPDRSFEADLDLDCLWPEPSETFLRTVEKVGFRAITNQTALRTYKKHRRVELTPDATPLNRIESIQLERAIAFCEEFGYHVRDYEIIVTADLGENTWGRAYEGRIYLNRSAFAAGTKIVAGTLIEEYLHLRHKLRDESRDLQNHLLNALVGMGELARGEPL
jgi:hypothetical protein